MFLGCYAPVRFGTAKSTERVWCRSRSSRFGSCDALLDLGGRRRGGAGATQSCRRSESQAADLHVVCSRASGSTWSSKEWELCRRILGRPCAISKSRLKIAARLRFTFTDTCARGCVEVDGVAAEAARQDKGADASRTKNDVLWRYCKTHGWLSP